MKNNEFIEGLKSIGITLDDLQIEKFKNYCDFLLEYNKTTNLTAIRDEEGVYLKHFFDSALICKYFDFSKVNNLIDIGSGAGFPGLVLKILYPNLKVTLLDSNNKKVKFLEKVSEILELDNVEFICDRAENFIKNRREYYDVSIARAVSELRIISELCLPFTKIGGNFIAMKANYETELEAAKTTFDVLNSKIKNIYETKLPVEESNRSFIIVEVQDKIDNKYPRPYDQIIKKQLK